MINTHQFCVIARAVNWWTKTVFLADL